MRGVHAIHCNRIMHRDLKPQNILLSDDRVIKIADFGLARAFSVPLRPYSHEVVTMWYRSPELLLGSTEYTIAVDMWSVGCIFFEMVAMRALFAGDTTIEMINLIFGAFGTPNVQVWPEYEQMPIVQQIQLPQHKGVGDLRDYHSLQNVLDDDGYDLLMKMLTFDPKQRIIASQALEHPYLN